MPITHLRKTLTDSSNLRTEVRFPLGSPLDRRSNSPVRTGPLTHVSGPCAFLASICAIFRVVARRRAKEAGNQPRAFRPSRPKNRPSSSLFLRKPATTPHLVASFSVVDWVGVTTTPLRAVRFPFGVPNVTASKTCNAPGWGLEVVGSSPPSGPIERIDQR